MGTWALKTSVVGLLALALVVQADEDGGRFCVPDNDLPYALVAGHEVAFTRNGAFVVGRGGRWLFDCGLSYAMEGWNEWGTQIRASDAHDSWRLAEDGTGDLITRGTMFDVNRVRRFTFVQRTSIIPGGLRFDYEVTPLEGRSPKEFGLTLHTPAEGAALVRVSFLPGFSECVLPKEHSGAVLGGGQSRAALLLGPDGPLCALVADESLEWRVVDDRQWQLNTFRVGSWQPAYAGPLAKGEAVKLSLDLLLGESAVATWQLTPWRLELDRFGRLAVRGDEGRKIVEGGLGQNGETAGWLFEHKVSEAALTRDQREGCVTASGTVLWEDSQVAYRVRVQADENSAVVALRLARQPAQRPQTESRFLMAVPMSELASPPQLQQDASQDIPAKAEEDLVLHMVRLVLQGGAEATLVATAPWTVRNGKVGGTDVYLLESPLTLVDEGVLQAEVRLTLPQERAEPQE